MNMQSDTTPGASRATVSPRLKAHIGQSQVDRLWFFEDQLRVVWLALGADPSEMDDRSTLSIRGIIDMVIEGLGDFRVEIDLPEDHP